MPTRFMIGLMDRNKITQELQSLSAIPSQHQTIASRTTQLINMVLKKHLELEALLLILFGIVIGLFFVIRSKQTPGQNFQTFPAIIASPTPTPTIAFIATMSTVQQISSDGTKKVVMKTTQNEDNS